MTKLENTNTKIMNAKLKGVAYGIVASMTIMTSNIYAEDYLTKGMSAASKALGAFGSVWTIWGLILMAQGISSHGQGAELKDGILRAISGALIVFASIWLTKINFSFA